LKRYSGLRIVRAGKHARGPCTESEGRETCAGASKGFTEVGARYGEDERARPGF